jgi:outer membrane biosynthesis protein TonB
MLGTSLKAIQYITIAPAVFKIVAELIQAFESEGNGAQKKQAVLDSLQIIYETTNNFVTLKVPFSFVKSLAEGTIEVIVGFYNLVGHFKHKQPETVVDAPVEAPVQEPVEAPAEPVQTPVEAPVEQPTPEPVQEPVTEPTQPVAPEQPQAPVEQPAPVETPAAPVENPAPVADPTQQPVVNAPQQ